LIALERIDSLTILPALFEPVFIPPEVEHEFGAAHPWLKVEPPTNQALVSSLKLLLGDGEAAAIALASQHRLPIILDDRQARTVARQLGLWVIGTVGCALKAKQAGVVAVVKPLLEKLEQQGFYLSPALKAEALRLARE
jgi:predicted nucleic acid-binding protein